jgi:hypothetical protein
MTREQAVELVARAVWDSLIEVPACPYETVQPIYERCAAFAIAALSSAGVLRLGDK